ncbi:DNA repair protein RecN [Paracoccaceae bacterium]|nr:DNA repair protein RecN [Paracoccaceae bacterium]MDC3205384.1 DNA repair protein RecN [Paracoccaceae bacterium]
MLVGLDIRDILIIDHAEIIFTNGLNVLTGETGAGKSILLDSLGFVLGWRGKTEIVRPGADFGEVSVWFEVDSDHPVKKILDENNIPWEEELLIRRVISADGRKTAWINGRRVPRELLIRLSPLLIEIHGQHDDKGLLDQRSHIHLLDMFAANNSQRELVKEAWKKLKKAEKELQDEQKKYSAFEAEESFLRYSLDELIRVDPKEGEEQELDAKRRMMQSAEKIKDDILKAQNAVGVNGAESLILDSMRWIETASGKSDGPFDDALASLSRASTELGEAIGIIEGLVDTLDFDAHELEMLEERLFEIRGLARKHKIPSDQLYKFKAELENEVAEFSFGAETLSSLEDKIREYDNGYNVAASKLNKSRLIAGAKLDKLVREELPFLKMENANFETNIIPAKRSANGSDDVSFVVSTNKGTAKGQIGKIASGGELSRFLLALKVCLTRGYTSVAMIFDEIDRGIGGATADAVGRRLVRLSKNAQVLIVTHSPQVAALGDAHFQVVKSITSNNTLTKVKPLDGDARIEEIARMISGDKITNAAINAAATLVDGR